MESIVDFFSRMFNRIVNRLSYQIRYKITDAADSKIRETVENSFNQSTKNKQQTRTDSQERKIKY